MTISAKNRILLRRMILFAIAILFFVIFVVLLSLSSRDRQVLFSRHRTTEVNNIDRQYLINVPKKLDKNTKIIVGLHGFSDTPRRFAYYTALHNAAGKNDIVVYPKASKPTTKNQKLGWNAGFCCGSGWVNKVDDVEFIVSLVKDIAIQYGAKQAKVYVTGFSNGAFMSQRLAAERPDIFAAIAPRSGSIGTIDKALELTVPVPILLSHGQKDITVPYYGGVGGSDPDFTWRSFDETLTAWETNNDDIAVVKTVINKDDAHSWHDWRLFNFWHQSPKGSLDIVSFFNKVSTPELD